MRVFIVVPCYGRPDLLERCAESIASQDDATVLIADDASPTRDQYKALRGCEDRGWIVRRQARNVGALRNIVDAVRHLEATADFDPDDVVILVDGDDELTPGAVGRIREAFADDTLVCYGDYRSEPPDPGCPPPQPIPPDILRWGMVRALTRDHGQFWNHPLAFRRRVFDVLRDDDFTIGGEWMRHAYDVILMVPMIEAAGARVKCLDSVNYIYRSDRPEAVHRIHEAEANAEHAWVVNQPRRYHPLDVEVDA